MVVEGLYLENALLPVTFSGSSATIILQLSSVHSTAIEVLVDGLPDVGSDHNLTPVVKAGHYFIHAVVSREIWKHRLVKHLQQNAVPELQNLGLLQLCPSRVLHTLTS
jgi:hypothetical protein